MQRLEVILIWEAVDPADTGLQRDRGAAALGHPDLEAVDPAHADAGLQRDRGAVAGGHLDPEAMDPADAGL